MLGSEWRKCKNIEEWGCDWNCEANDITSMWHIGDRVICDVCLFCINDLLCTFDENNDG